MPKLEDAKNEHVHLVSMLMRILRQPGLLDELREQETAGGFLAALRKAEGKVLS